MTDEQLLYGHGQREHIVGVRAYGESEVRVHSRSAPGEKAEARRERVHPFFWLKPSEEVKPEELGAKHVRRLAGDREHSHLLVFDSRSDFYRARSAVRYSEGDASTEGPSSMTEMYLMQSGETMFGGFGSVNDARRMQIDLEVLSPTGGFPQAGREEDRICMASLSGNFVPTDREYRAGPQDQYERLLEIDGAEGMGEKQLLAEIVREVNRRDPDVLELHNGFGFDLPYMQERADRHGITLALGRGAPLEKGRKRTKDFAERSFEFQSFTAPGRAIVDTMFLAADFDVYARDLPSLGLKDVARYFDVAAPERTYIDGEDLTRMWNEDRRALRRYAMDDVRETRGVSEVLLPSGFFLTQIVPMTLGRSHLAGTAAQLESIMKRGYLHKRHSIPEPDSGASVMGGLTEIFLRGLHKRCAYADVSSLYPSIMMKYGFFPSSDDLGFLRRALTGLTEQRLQHKKLMGEAADRGDERAERLFNAQQQAEKILINSAYGMMGAVHSCFNDMKAANEVTAKGQDLLREMIGRIEDEGGTAVLADTDGCMFSLAEGSRDDLIGRVDSGMPPGIEIDNDGEFSRVLAYKKKNYAKRKEVSPHPDEPRADTTRSGESAPGTGDLTITGGGLKARNIEQFGRDYIEAIVEHIVDEEFSEARKRHLYWTERIYRGEATAEELAKSSTLKRTPEEDRKRVRTNENRNPMGQYEAGARIEERTGEKMGPGSSVTWFVANRNEKGRKRSEGASVASLARGADLFGEVEVSREYYLDRLRTLSRRFEGFFTAEDFRTIFPDPTDPQARAQGLFAPDPAAARVKETVLLDTATLREEKEEIPF